MKFTQTTIIIFFLGLFAITSTAQQNKKTLKNADVVLMSQKGLGDSVIIKAIGASETDFDISPDALIQLHDSNVNDKIIEAMQDAQARRKDKDSVQPVTSVAISTFGKVTPIQAKPTPFTPITQQEQLFTFRLEKCSVFSTSVTCYLTIINAGQTRQLNISNRATEMVYDSGKSSKYDSYKLGGAAGTSTVNIDAGIKFSTNTSVEAFVSFSVPVLVTHKIEKLNLGFYSIPGSEFTIQFRDVSLKTEHGFLGNSWSNGGSPKTDTPVIDVKPGTKVKVMEDDYYVPYPPKKIP